MAHVVFYPSRSADIQQLAERLLPPGFTLEHAAPGLSIADTAALFQRADYVMGFFGPLPAEVWDAAIKRTRLVQILSAGYDKFPIAEVRRVRLPVCTNGGANAISVAEHAVMLMLAVYRRLGELLAITTAGGWVDSLQGNLVYHELYGKQIGLLGLGNIGREVAKRLRGFEPEIVYHDVRRLSPSVEAELGAAYVTREELLGSSDIVSLHMPLLPATRNTISDAELSAMKPGAVLINTARGGLVDEAALLRALQSGHLGGAGLDVLAQEPPSKDNPLSKAPNVVLTPHTAGPTWESWPRRIGNAYLNFARVERGEQPLWLLPELADLFPGT